VDDAMMEDGGLSEWEIRIVLGVHGQWDSHADTVVGGCNFILLHETGVFAMVHFFSDEWKPFEKVLIGTIATAWVDPAT
jgi:hypothetical protein